MLEQLRKQSEKHMREPDFKFFELSKHMRNPALYNGDWRLSCLKNESFEPGDSPFSKKVELAAMSLLDALYPQERLARDELLASAKEKLKGSVYLASGKLPMPSLKAAVPALKARIDDPAFERLMAKMIKAHGFDGPVGKKLLWVCWRGLGRKIAPSGAVVAQSGPDFIIGAKSKALADSAIKLIEAFCEDELLAEPPKLEAKKRARFLSVDVSAVCGIALLVPEGAVEETLRRLGAADQRQPWRGKKIDSLIGASSAEILKTCNSWLEAFRLRHLMAENAKGELGKLRRVLRMSMLHTIAASSNTTVLKAEAGLRLKSGQLGIIESGKEIKFG
jgi:hypothetical protein